MIMEIVPITFATATAFVAEHHRHNKPPRGWKFGVGVAGPDGKLVGVALAGRPVARALDDGRTIEVNRTCTTGEPNANSMLYGAVWRAAKALGYLRAYTYTQHDESGASLRAAGWVRDADLPARGSWAEHSVHLRKAKDPEGSGGVARVRWRIERTDNTPKSRPESDPVHLHPESISTENGRTIIPRIVIHSPDHGVRPGPRCTCVQASDTGHDSDCPRAAFARGEG